MDLIGHVDQLHKQLLAMSIEEKAVSSLSSADPQGLAKKYITIKRSSWCHIYR
jgi:hypothetical protein